MSIPTKINYLRWIAAIFQVKYSGPLTLPKLESALLALADILGIDGDKARKFGKDALGRLLLQVTQKLGSAEAALELDMHTQHFVNGCKSLLDSIPREQWQEYASRFDAWARPRTILSTKDFEILNPFIVLHMAYRLNPDKWMKECVQEIRRGLRPLIAMRSERFRQSLKLWTPLADPMTPDGSADLQAQGRILYKVAIGGEAKAKKKALDRCSVENLLSAWSTSYETTIFHACSLLWMASNKSRKPVSFSAMPGHANGRVEKGRVFIGLVAWFKRAGLVFPFYESLNKIRNSYAHGSWSFDDKRRVVHFGKVGASQTFVLPFDDIEYHATHDIGLAAYFSQGVLMALLDQDNQDGRYDAAWRRFMAAAADFELDDDGPIFVAEARDLDDESAGDWMPAML
jgi:hypothetical protein